MNKSLFQTLTITHFYADVKENNQIQKIFFYYWLKWDLGTDPGFIFSILPYLAKKSVSW